MARREYAGAAPATTLNGTITNVATAIVVTDGTGYPTGLTGNFVLTLSSGLASEEKILCSARSGNNITAVTRGYDGTSAAAHDNGAKVEHTLSAVDLDEANAHVNASTGVHGRTGAVVGTTDAQTLTNKTLTTPTIGSFTNAQHTHADAPGGGSILAVGVRAYASIAPAISAVTNTAIALGAENFDTSAFHDPGTNPSRFTVPAGMTGLYALKGQISFQSGAGDLHAIIRLNGVTTLVEAQLSGSAGSGTKVTVVTDEALSAGDYVELVAYQNTGGSLGVDAGRSLTYLSLVRLGS